MSYALPLAIVLSAVIIVFGYGYFHSISSSNTSSQVNVTTVNQANSTVPYLTYQQYQNAYANIPNATYNEMPLNGTAYNISYAALIGPYNGSQEGYVAIYGIKPYSGGQGVIEIVVKSTEANYGFTKMFGLFNQSLRNGESQRSFSTFNFTLRNLNGFQYINTISTENSSNTETIAFVGQKSDFFVTLICAGNFCNSNDINELIQDVAISIPS